VLLYGIVIPLASRFLKFFSRLVNWCNFPIVPLACVGFFVVGLAHGQTITKWYPDWTHTEIKELMLSVGFLFFGISYFKKWNQ